MLPNSSPAAVCRIWTRFFQLLVFTFTLTLAVAGESRAQSCLSDSKTACSSDSECCAGLVCKAQCKPGCKIDGVFVAADKKNPSNPCQSCQPSVNRFAWSNVSAGATCGGAPRGLCDAQDLCDGRGVCTEKFAPATQECRAADGVCDVAEFCSGSSGQCPSNAKIQNCDRKCRIGKVFFEPGTLNPENPCLSCQPAVSFTSWTPVAAGASCGAAPSGACDVADSCDGAGSCVDNVAGSSTECRASSGGCDVGETCNGTDKTCPADRFVPSGTVCRGASGDCDNAEVCTGTSGACPADSFRSQGSVCRPAGGVCDVAETCTGTGPSCPGDKFLSSATACRGKEGECDGSAELCTGSSSICPAPGGYKSAGSPCSVGLCGGANATCCNEICAVGSCGLQENGCGGTKDCGVCVNETAPPVRACAVGLVRDSSGVCKRRTGGICSVDSECLVGFCECVGEKSVVEGTPELRCDDAAGVCRGSIGAACNLQSDCVSFARCENHVCVTNLPDGTSCHSPIDFTQVTPLDCYVEPENRRSLECASGWCLKNVFDPARGSRENGSPVCCRELDEVCDDDADCCVGTTCTDNSATPRRIRRCLPDTNGIKHCAKFAIVGESCSLTSDCYPAGIVSCVNGVCASSQEIVKKRGEVCSYDNGVTKQSCEAGNICANCNDTGLGYRCIAEDRGCCSRGPDLLDECGRGAQCCNFKCASVEFDQNNCGGCGITCNTVPAYLNGGEDCYNTPGSCSQSKCHYQNKCGDNQSCTVLAPSTPGGAAAITLCSSPFTPSTALFNAASQLGSFDFLVLEGPSSVCQSDGDCLASQKCSNSCNEALYIMGAVRGSGVSAACVIPGNCVPR